MRKVCQDIISGEVKKFIDTPLRYPYLPLQTTQGGAVMGQILTDEEMGKLRANGYRTGTVWYWGKGGVRPHQRVEEEICAILGREPWPTRKIDAYHPVLDDPLPLPNAYVRPADTCATLEACRKHLKWLWQQPQHHHPRDFSRCGNCRRRIAVARAEARERIEEWKRNGHNVCIDCDCPIDAGYKRCFDCSREVYYKADSPLAVI
jgi:hypothetical protein